MYLDVLSIDKVSTTNDLGVYFSKNLSWSNHINNKLANCNCSLFFVKRNVPFSAPVKTKFNIYVACVKSILLYNSSIWYPAISDLHKMEALQKRAFKWVFGRRDYRDSLISVGSLSICYELILSDLILFSKLLQGFYEFNISDYVTLAITRPSLRSVSRMVFQLHPFKNFTLALLVFIEL